MKKREVQLIIITVLIISTIYLAVKYMSLANENNYQKDSINLEFKTSLSLAAEGFAVDFDKMKDENSKQYYYNEAMSNLYSASLLVNVSSYNQNKNLDIALYNLYKLMEQTKYREGIIKKSKLLYDNLIRLSQNPIDSEATANVIKLTEEIRTTTH